MTLPLQTFLKIRWPIRSILVCWTLAVGAMSSAGGQSTGMGHPQAEPPKETRFFPLSEVRRGQHGVAYTVFEGVDPEPMQVEILGVLKNSLGPGRDMILARLHGDKPEYTGVVAGMSGSPVYIDGRLVGALSFRIGQFSKEPIAGITPIAEMLEIRDTPPAGQSSAAGPTRAAAQMEGQPEMQAMETPLIFSGFNQETLDRFGDRFRAIGLTPVAGLGGTDAELKQPEPIVPGSAVSAIFVRGDLGMAGTCTVTYVDASRLLACGHPITQSGPVSMPMTKATVVATLPSPLNAFKIVNTTETVGSFTEDRAAAILGRFGVAARMIPVVVDVVTPAKSRTFHFEVLNDRELTPQTMLVSVYQALQGTNAAAVEQSYVLTGELDIEGHAGVQLGGVMAPNGSNSGAIQAALYVGERFARVYENAVEQPTITGMRLRVETKPQRLTAALDSARVSMVEVRAGETIEVEVNLRPYQAEARVISIPVTLPASLAQGPVRLVVSDGATLDRLTNPSGAAAQHAVGLSDTVGAMNRAHANDRIYVTLLEHSAQAVLDAGALPGIPVSMANVLETLKENQQVQLTGESAIELGSTATAYAVSGSQVVRVVVR